DDGDLCTGTETCSPEGLCTAGEPVVCDDGDPCTFDGCLVTAGGCVSVPDTTLCTDDDPCTVDSCLASGCVNEAKDCDDDDLCTDDACDSESGECVHTEVVDGPPACDAPPTLDQLQITVRTASASADAATDDDFELCLGEGLCLTLDTPGYDELEAGAVNEFLWPVDGLDASAITWVSISAGDAATDNWRPTCISVVADGALLYCNDELGFTSLGQGTGDDPGWTDLDKATKTCASCYPTVLSHGPLIGHTTSTSARVWLRTAYSAEVVVRYGTQADLADGESLAPAVPTMAEDFVTVVELTDLTPATTYFYEVTVDGTVARSGLSFTTAPAGPASFDVAFGSCAKYTIDPSMPIFEDILRHPLFRHTRSCAPGVERMFGVPRLHVVR
ncbi:MAG: hypothetical protein QF464_22260, partial [Myxococcota bacterium]|nr:hypothetical protein [Myxococcota bacterium]